MKMLARLIVIGLIIVGGVAIVGISATKNTPKTSTVNVATSFYPIYFLTSQVAGDRVEITNIIPPGIEPHDYELTTNDLKILSESDLVLVNGGVEAWAEKIDNVVALGKPLMTEVDPHVWLDPLNAIKMTAEIAAQLKKIDSKNAKVYEDNADKVIEKLDMLDTDMRNGLAMCTRRKFITSHAAFGYLAKRYNLTQVEISGLSPEDEPTTKRLAEVAKIVADDGIKYIFFETLVSPDLANTIADETGAKTLVLNPLEGLSEAEIAAGDDYFSVQRKNLENLRTALECK